MNRYRDKYRLMPWFCNDLSVQGFAPDYNKSIDLQALISYKVHKRTRSVNLYNNIFDDTFYYTAEYLK